MLIDGEVDEQVVIFLEHEGVCFKDISNCSLKLSSVKKDVEIPVQEEEPKEQEQKEAISKVISKDKLKVFDRPIRSGEEINEDLPVVVFGRINSGAKLFCTQSVSVYGTIDGLVQCDGDYIVLNGIGNHGNVIFNGEIIEKESLVQDKLQKITYNGSKVDIKEI
ncbi:septum site-determining protein MinC [Sulfurospirillum arcachonense]|uniref:septum site-determining protein MinC n=1 Tax=Sulfurospirillum arcachonense TaxID=57666 RepID=UPI001FE0F96E|nr:septum site-determining protein MinC [Sulfurospirillum arcachonense]